MSTKFEYAGRPDLKDKVLEVLERDWNADWRDPKVNLKVNLTHVLYEDFALYAQDIDITSAPRNFDFQRYVGLYRDQGISVLISEPSGDKYLFNVTLMEMAELIEILHFDRSDEE